MVTPLARLSANSLRLLLARVVGQALTLVFTLAVARTLGREAFGQFAFISAVVFVGNVITTFGMDTMLIREVAAARPAGQSELARLIAAAGLWQLTLSAIFIGALLLIGPRLPNQTADTLPALYVAALSLIPLAFSTVYSAILRGRQMMGGYAWFSIATAAILGGGALVFGRRGGTLLGATGVLLLAQTGGAVAAYLLCRSYLPDFSRQWVRPTRRQLARAWRTGVALAGLMILAVVYQRLDVMLLSFLAGDAATGTYSAAMRVLEALKIIPGAFFGALLPMMAAGARPEVRHAYRLSFAALIGLSLLLAALTAALARPLIDLLFGPGYATAAAPLRVVSWSLPLTVITFKLSFDLVVRGKERIAGLGMLLTLAAATPITFVLIRQWSLLGAAIALIICEAGQILILAALTKFDHRLYVPARTPTTQPFS